MELIAPGIYRARAVRLKNAQGADVWARRAQGRQGPGLAVMVFELLDEHVTGRRVRWFFTLDERPHILEGLRHCGFQGNDLGTLDEQTLDAEVSVKVEHVPDPNSNRVYQWVAFVDACRGVAAAHGAQA